MIIDMEHHAFSTGESARVGSTSGKFELRVNADGTVVRSGSGDACVEDHLEFMDEAGIDMAVVSTNADMSVERSRSWNDSCAALVKKYPKLKICLAHFGGTYEMEKPSATNWYHQILEMISNKDNQVFTDVSYSLWDSKHHGKLKEAIADPASGDRILFGTDFYMTEREKKEIELAGNFRTKLGEGLFEKAAYTNVKRFLNSEYYGF